MRWKVSLAAAALLATATLPSAAQVKLDMNRMTCGTWLKYSPEQQSFVRFWMSGYYNAAANSNALDYDRMRKNSAKVAAYCKRNKSDTLPTAIKKTIS
jgi:acid stress chaperone HdeB